MYYLLLLTAGLLGWAFAPLQAQNLPGARAHLESPSEDSFESGIGLIRGWVCDATTVEVQMDSGERWLTAYGTQREDTATVCGDTNNGFGLTFNWNRIGDGAHTLRAFTNGVEFANVTFNVTTLGQEYLRGASGEYTLPNFPSSGNSVAVRWSEPHQNFVIASANGKPACGSLNGAQPASTEPVASSTPASLESPSPGSCESGIGLIRGWVCDATTVEVQMDSGERWLTAYGTQREDTATVCGDTNNGFGLTFNWNRLGDGPHILRAFADGVEFANVTFNVTTLGQEYLRGASGIYPLFNFPIPNQNIVVSWQESSQNFVIIDSSLRQEAEKALTGSNGSSIFRSRASADAVWHLNNPGDKADYDIQVPVTGNYKLIVRYSNDDTGIGDDIKVYVNGVYKNQFHTQNTRPPGVKLGDGWDIFVNTPVIHLKNLADGYPDGHIEFTFELVSTDGFGVDLDLFSLAPEF